MHRDKQPLTGAELGTDDLGALGGGCQGHCQGWGGDLDRRSQIPQSAGVRVDDERLPLGEMWGQRGRLETKILGQVSSFGERLVSGPWV